MSRPPQNTVASEATLEGIGVHSGAPATLTIRPAEPDTGIRFRRVDLDGCPEVPATLEHVVGTEMGTTLGKGETRVLTVEHVLSALAGARVDNAVLDLSGPEIPIRDGSFRDYLAAVEEVGVVPQDEPARVVELPEPVSTAGEKGQTYVAAPAPTLRLSVTIDFDHPSIGRQYGSFEPGDGGFRTEIAAARTFGFEKDAEVLRERGLARGASLENTVVLDADGVLNDGLRFPDEFLRHKVGDLIGDLALLGGRLSGHVVAERPNHEGNVALARAIAERARRGAGQPIVDAQQIMQYLPHRYPMLLVDRIVEFESGKRIVGLKNVTINEPFFQGHYPGNPVMPGVLIIEAMAQVGGLLLMDVVDRPDDYVMYFMSLDNVKWRRPIVPGDQIVFELEMLQFRRHVCRLKGVGRVEGKVAAEAELMARLVEVDRRES